LTLSIQEDTQVFSQPLPSRLNRVIIIGDLDGGVCSPAHTEWCGDLTVANPPPAFGLCMPFAARRAAQLLDKHNLNPMRQLIWISPITVLIIA
jgi:hypothetical protein